MSKKSCRVKVKVSPYGKTPITVPSLRSGGACSGGGTCGK
jgi:hypothetical protein